VGHRRGCAAQARPRAGPELLPYLKKNNTLKKNTLKLKYHKKNGKQTNPNTHEYTTTYKVKQ